MDSKIWPSVRPSLSKSGQFPQTRCKSPSSLNIPSIELAAGDIWGNWVWDHADGENLINPQLQKQREIAFLTFFLWLSYSESCLCCLISFVLMKQKMYLWFGRKSWFWSVKETGSQNIVLHVMYVVLYSCVVRIYYTNDSSFKMLWTLREYLNVELVSVLINLISNNLNSFGLMAISMMVGYGYLFTSIWLSWRKKLALVVRLLSGLFVRDQLIMK